VDSKRIDILLNLVSEAVINKASFGQLAQVLADTEEEIVNADAQLQSRLQALFDSVPGLLEAHSNGGALSATRNELMTSFSDLFDSFKQVSSKFKESYNLFRATAQNLGRITGELQEGVMQIRMVPISQIFTRFPRLVRDVSKALGKKVRLEIEGEDTELDKSVIEDLLDPLIHCVRNAVDHGVEMPEERVRAGKDETGTVILKASNEGNQIVIAIADDGKGIDIDSVHRKAVDRKVIHPDKKLSDIEAFNLIFEPGFSTASKVTDISGRGVGLDVVRKQIEKLNGSVSVWSEPEEGTKITIKLPLTLAIIQGLLIKVGPEIYAVPITSVLESQRIDHGDIKLIDNYEVLNLRDEVISLLRMNRLFGIQTDDDVPHFYVVIVGSEENKVGLVVDSMIGEEDVVIKPLADRFTSTPGIAGATILGDGKVALIVDVGQLLELGHLQSQEERTKRAQAIV
jgi:two-component system chemotaxis sensor kinase CheA